MALDKWLPCVKFLYKMAKDRYFYLMSSESFSGMMDAPGKLIGDPRYTKQDRFSEGVSPAALGKKPVDRDVKCGYTDMAGKFLIVPQSISCKPFSESLARVTAIVDRVGS